MSCLLQNATLGLRALAGPSTGTYGYYTQQVELCKADCWILHTCSGTFHNIFIFLYFHSVGPLFFCVAQRQSSRCGKAFSSKLSIAFHPGHNLTICHCCHWRPRQTHAEAISTLTNLHSIGGHKQASHSQNSVEMYICMNVDVYSQTDSSKWMTADNCWGCWSLNFEALSRRLNLPPPDPQA